jgi:histidinol-phosphatase (PHP family)
VRANYHTHCEFCDGRSTAAEMASAASAAGYQVLGFSSHCPLPFPADGNMELSRLGEYKAEVRRLGREWEGRGLEVLAGLEIDWIPGLCSPRDEVFAKAGLDYKIGSIHYIELPGSGRFAVDYGLAEVEAWLAACSDREPGRAMYETYYSRLSELIESGGFDILGHFDLVKKNNGGLAGGRGRFFDESSLGYRDAALGAARLLAGKDIVVEINVGGMSRGKVKEPYPSLAILKELRAERVRITFSADAHATEHLGSHLDVARQLAREAGYESVAVLTKGSWIETGLDET